MKITPEIMQALEKAIDHHGNVSQFAKHVGLAHSTILFWKSGKTTSISGNVWANKLRPALIPFIEAKPTIPIGQLDDEILLASASNHIMTGIQLLIRLELKKSRHFSQTEFPCLQDGQNCQINLERA